MNERSLHLSTRVIELHRALEIGSTTIPNVEVRECKVPRETLEWHGTTTVIAIQCAVKHASRSGHLRA